MTKSTKKSGIPKIELCIEQFIDAVWLFQNQRFASAITLAGAAEEVSSQLLKLEGKASNQQITVGAFKMAEFKDIHGIKKPGKYLNNTKNELKHHGEENKEIIYDNLEQRAMMHIANGFTNLKLLGRDLRQVPEVHDFCTKYGLS